MSNNQSLWLERELEPYLNPLQKVLGAVQVHVQAKGIKGLAVLFYEQLPVKAT